MVVSGGTKKAQDKFAIDPERIEAKCGGLERKGRSSWVSRDKAI